MFGKKILYFDAEILDVIYIHFFTITPVGLGPTVKHAGSHCGGQGDHADQLQSSIIHLHNNIEMLQRQDIHIFVCQYYVTDTAYTLKSV